MELPRLLPVRQRFPRHAIENLAEAVEKELAASGLAERLRPGAPLAIGAGSRGIAGIGPIVRAVVAFWKARGARPFVFPAMGSHGAATAEGQAGVLAHYGITEALIGCPVVSSLDVVPLGATGDGIETFMDRCAYEAGAVFLVNRVKWHTDFEAPIESGLYKMMAIGLGKFAGAERYHMHALRMGYEPMLRSVGRRVLASGKVLGGLAIIEDAYHNAGCISAVGARDMEAREEELLALAKRWKPRILAGEVDVLIVDEMGKHISGAGMDTKVINRGTWGQYNPWPDTPVFHRVFVRDLSPLSYGNATGVGLADMTTRRLVEKIDWPATMVNCLTANNPVAAKIPPHYDTDRECVETLARIVGKPEARDVTFAWIHNTLELEHVAMSENLLPLLAGDPKVEILGPPRQFPFDDSGNLVAMEQAFA